MSKDVHHADAQEHNQANDRKTVAFFLRPQPVVLEYDTPVPGAPTEVVTPRLELTETWAPLTPALMPRLPLPTLSRTPLPSPMDLRYRIPTIFTPFRFC